MTGDPHLEEVAPYTAMGRRAAVAQVVVAVGGFVAAVALVPERWLPMIAFYVGLSFVGGLFSALLTWRRLRRLFRAASSVPPAAVEVERHGSRIRLVCGILYAVAFLLGGGWFWSAFDDAPFGWGVLFVSALLGVYAVAEVVVRWAVGRWERRNGRVLTSLLLGAGEVFYVERGARPA